MSRFLLDTWCRCTSWINLVPCWQNEKTTGFILWSSLGERCINGKWKYQYIGMWRWFLVFTCGIVVVVFAFSRDVGLVGFDFKKFHSLNPPFLFGFLLFIFDVIIIPYFTDFSRLKLHKILLIFSSIFLYCFLRKVLDFFENLRFSLLKYWQQLLYLL